MGILTRFKDIMSANINALLDKCEDPEKMIDQYMRNLESDLGKVKAETASVMAEETRAKRELDECTEQINKMQAYAEKALKAGNESDARSFLEKKQQLATTQAALTQAYNVAADNAAKMRQMHDKLVKDISSLEARRTAIKATVKAAKAQERINKVGSSVVGASNSMDAFNKMEARLTRCLMKLMLWLNLMHQQRILILIILQLSMMLSQLILQLMMNLLHLRHRWELNRIN